jgi:hypothetical protein
MECFTDFYERLEALTVLPTNNSTDDTEDDVITVDISNPNISIDYFNKIDHLSSVLVAFYDNYIADARMHQALHELFNTRRRKNYDDLKLALMVDVVRAYEGLDHSTSLQTPEGIALLMLLVKMFRPDYFINYSELNAVPSDIINLDGIVPYISACSDEMSTVEEGLIISKLLSGVHSKAEPTYRKCLYYLFEAVSNVDGVISISEKEYLMELLNLNDDDVSNDISVESSIDLK